MRKVIILLLSALILTACGDSNVRYVKKAIRIMDKHGIYAKGEKWEEAKKEALSSVPQTLKEAQEIVRKAGKVSGGKHTFLITADEVVAQDSTKYEMPTLKVLEDGIVSIKLPAFSDNQEEGVMYANTVLKAIPDDIKGIVLDLRDNRGGNMYPMITAIHRFLPDDELLAFSSRKRPMIINKDYVVSTVGVKKQTNINCPIAILTNEWTGSSGEAVLICFRGMENTRTFGSPTAGYASCNQTYSLPGGDYLVLTIGEDIARTGEVFCDDPIKPDVVTDTPLEKALEWLKNSHKE